MSWLSSCAQMRWPLPGLWVTSQWNSVPRGVWHGAGEVKGRVLVGKARQATQVQGGQELQWNKAAGAQMREGVRGGHQEQGWAGGPGVQAFLVQGANPLYLA